ncbi:diguanylate cyclase (GGDEF)-like protein [Blastococcus xanthinilyticus]|uniref:Diguanylate cyclase (GGDEF)-like protein n=1 Tax=Blastococcus xanthinilyticus TaxID=1564164 RepID=A0A5S5D420_9ACTN|nr:diguanylate cyclase (GGDEF)-like protein [Blastococcus xanthinilyticus]
MATVRVMARTLATFYAFGGAAGLCICAGAPAGARRSALVVLSLVALAAAAVVARWGARWPRPVFHGTVGVATVLIATAVAISPDSLTALGASVLIAFVVVDAHLFFSGRQALAHLVGAVVAVTGALLLSGVPLGTALGVDLVLIGLGMVIRRLVIRASGASRDPLTGLRNRRGFDEAMRELMGEASRTREPLSAVLIDVDHFKSVNDSHGHEAGDRVLCRVAEVWGEALPHGSVLARHGGDEFSLLLPGIDPPEALALVRSVCTLHPDISLSCGVAGYSFGESASQLMRSADRALYDAKVLGRGRAELVGGAGSGGAVPGSAPAAW